MLDGPLQISRHNGDLVATRPAPLPPSTKPHSKTHPPKSFKKHKSIHTKAKSVEDAIHPRSGTHKSFRAIKEKVSPPLPGKDSQNKDETPAPKDLRDTKTPKTPKLKSEAQWPSRNSTDEIPQSPKMKKSFTLAMPSFRRTKDPRATTLREPRLSVVLSSRSESSLLPDPQAPEAFPDGPPRLSSHSDPSLDLDVDADHDAGTASKRNDLRLQLPRLQTQDLRFGNSFEPLSIDKDLVAQIQTKQPLPAQQPPQNQMQGAGGPSFCAPGPTHQVQHHHRHPHPAQAATSGDAKRSTLPLQLRIIPPEDEKMLVASEIVASERLRHTQAFVSTAQASSVQLPPEQIFELAATPPSPTSTIPAMFIGSPHMSVDFPVDMPEPLIISMMERIDSLDDLFNFVLVNKRFYRIFKGRELHFI